LPPRKVRKEKKKGGFITAGSSFFPLLLEAMGILVGKD
jgi:hypothetical protein